MPPVTWKSCHHCLWLQCLKKHLDELLENSMEDNKFQCELCHEEHNIPDKGFVVNRRIQDELDIELNKFKPSQMSEEC